KRISAFYLRKSKFSARLLFWFSLLIEDVRFPNQRVENLFPSGSGSLSFRFKFISMPSPAGKGADSLGATPQPRPKPASPPLHSTVFADRSAAFAAFLVEVGRLNPFSRNPLGQADVTRLVHINRRHRSMGCFPR